ncbi:MAG: ABC transporter substrate-binding protein [Chloroflexi bacterium]|nr:ABC transporter substrate-binding protein [Chloroflexota bacterium]
MLRTTTRRAVRGGVSWLLALVLVLASGCLSSPRSAEPSKSQRPTVRIGATNFGEQGLLAELYGQALEANGYRVQRALNLGGREAVEPALESGQIDMYVEYLASALAFVTRGRQLGSPDPNTTHQQLHEAFKPRGITVLDFAPAANSNGIVVTRETADRYNLTAISDLVPIANRLVFGGPPECPLRPFCLPGLRQTYGVQFRDFRPLDAGGPLTSNALASGQVDVALLFTTDPRIASSGWVLLADDRGLQLADNVAPVVRSALLATAPPEFATTLNAVSASLTTAELTQLNAEVIAGNGPRGAALAWLRERRLAT